MEAYVGVELPDEAGKVVVLEILWEQISGEDGGVPDHKARPVGVPGYDVINCGIIDQLIGFAQKRRRRTSLRLAGSGLAVLFHRRRSHV